MIRIIIARLTPDSLLALLPGPPAPRWPLDLLNVAGAVRQGREQDVDVQIFTLTPNIASEDTIAHQVEMLDPDVVILGARSVDAGRLSEAARISRSVSRDVSVVAFGPLATREPERVLENPSVDLAVIGEPELTLRDLLDTLIAGGDTRTVSGLAWRGASGRTERSTPRPFAEDLDSLPEPAWELASLNAPASSPAHEELPPLALPCAPLQTSRGRPGGTPYDEIICGDRIRVHSTDRLIQRMRMLHERHHVREFHLLDDALGMDGDHLLALLDAVVQSNLDVSLAVPHELCMDGVDERLLRRFRKAGGYRVSFFLDTVSERILKRLGRDLDPERVLRGIRMASGSGLITHCTTMLGFPGETPDERRRTVEALRTSDADMARIEAVHPFPGTRLFDLALEHGFAPPALQHTFRPGEDEPGVVRPGTRELDEEIHQARQRVHDHPPRSRRVQEILSMYHGPRRPALEEDPHPRASITTDGDGAGSEAPPVVLAMFHTLAHDGKFSGNIQLSLLSGELERLGIRHETLALIMRPSDSQQNETTVQQFLELMRKWRPRHIVLYAMWLPWIADTLRDETGARVMSLDPAQPGDVPRRFDGFDLQSAIVATILGAQSMQEAISILGAEAEGPEYRPSFRYQFVGVKEPVEQKMAFVSLLSCPYTVPLAENPVYADLRLDADVSRHGCAYCNGARQYSPMDEDRKRSELARQIRYMQARIPTLEEVAVPFPEDYLDALTWVFENASRWDLRPMVISGQFRSESIVELRPQLERMLQAARDGGFEFHMNVVGLESFLDEDLNLFNRGTGAGVRQALQILRELRRIHSPEFFMPSTVGSFILFHPWQTLQGLRANLDAMQREGVAGIFETININDMRFHPGVAMYHLARRDGLLVDVEDGAVQDVPLGGYFSESPWRFLHEDTARVHGLFSALQNMTNDRIGLLEACVRLLERDPGARPDAPQVQQSLRDLSRLVMTHSLPRSMPRHVVHVGSQANTGHRRGIFQGRRFSDRKEAAEQVVEALSDLTASRLSLAGPEPTLLRWLPGFIRDLSGQAREVELITHGRMLAYDSYCAALASAHTHLVTVLLYSPEASIHDEAVRVPGCFSQATSGLQRLRDLSGGHVRTSLGAVVGPENRGRLSAMVDLAARLSCFELRFIVPLGNLDLDRIRENIRELEDALELARRRGLRAGFDTDLGLQFSL